MLTQTGNCTGYSIKLAIMVITVGKLGTKGDVNRFDSLKTTQMTENRWSL